MMIWFGVLGLIGYKHYHRIVKIFIQTLIVMLMRSRKTIQLTTIYKVSIVRWDLRLAVFANHYRIKVYVLPSWIHYIHTPRAVNPSTLLLLTTYAHATCPKIPGNYFYSSSFTHTHSLHILHCSQSSNSCNNSNRSLASYPVYFQRNRINLLVFPCNCFLRFVSLYVK